jgi:hypothetical protein
LELSEAFSEEEAFCVCWYFVVEAKTAEFNRLGWVAWENGEAGLAHGLAEYSHATESFGFFVETEAEAGGGVGTRVVMGLDVFFSFLVFGEGAYRIVCCADGFS